MEWRNMLFMFPETRRSLNVFINRESNDDFFTLHSLFNTLGYLSSTPVKLAKRGELGYLNPDCLTTLDTCNTPYNRFRGGHNKICVIRQADATRILKQNKFHKQSARRLAPKLLRWIKDDVISKYNNEAPVVQVDVQAINKKFLEIRNLLKTGIDLISVEHADLFWIKDATSMLHELENNMLPY